jgi:membrane protein implicated in regulation of membrane protease activity
MSTTKGHQAIATIIITIYVAVAELAVPAIYNYWAIMGLDIFGVIFWLSSFITMAVEASNFGTFNFYDYYFVKRYATLVKRDTTNAHTYKNVMAATAAMGALELYVV